MKNACELVQDLLPLYVDNMLKEQSREFVEAHLPDCPTCKAIKAEVEQSKIWQMEPEQVILHSVAARKNWDQEFASRVKSWKRRTAILFWVLLVVVSGVSWFAGKTFQNEHQPANVQIQEENSQPKPE